MINQTFDLALRSAGYLDNQNLDSSNLIAKRLLTTPIILCAAKHYIEQQPIQTLNDMQGLTGIEFHPDSNQNPSIHWESSQQHQHIFLKKHISCNDIDTSIKLCLLGGGIIKVAKINVDQTLKTGELIIEILPDMNWGSGMCSLYIPTEIYHNEPSALLIS